MTSAWRISLFVLLPCILAAGGVSLANQTSKTKPSIWPNTTDDQGRYTMPNGWKLTPAGRAIALPGDMPGTMALTKDGKYLVVNTCGYHGHSVNVIDTGTEQVIQRVDVGRDWVGLTFSADENELLVSGGSAQTYNRSTGEVGKDADVIPDANAGAILRFDFANGHLTSKEAISIPGVTGKDSYISGLLGAADGSLYAINIQTDTVYRLTRSDYPEVISQQKVGYRPYAVALSPDGTTLAVSNWGEKTVCLLNPDSLAVRHVVKVGNRPGALSFSTANRLYVVNAGDNTVSKIEDGKVTETIRTSLRPDATVGSTPVALTFSHDGKMLYVANADNNDVAVISTEGARSEVLGFIPTGRYPCTLAVSADDKRLFIGTNKGLRSRPNLSQNDIVAIPTGENEKIKSTYVADLMEGHVSVVDTPSAEKLRGYTAQVVANIPDSSALVNTPISQDVLKALKGINHVIYVIRENRTYDQVLGDVAKGNGEPKLTMFGEKITPNSHQLVKDFVLMDNLYCDGEVSQVGHQWTDADYAGDYNEKQWTLNYSRHGEVDSDARLTASPGTYIWDNAKSHGKTARIYGEYVQWQEDHDSAIGDVKKDPEKYGCSAAFEEVFARDGRDTEKVSVFLKEMKAAESTNKWWNLMVMALPEDHTNGASPGHNTPQAMVANNDLALGQLVEGVSHSKFWPTTAIFVIQDDAQSGADHVDCHRTVGLVISPLIRRGMVDHTHYTTSSMIRTMGLMLGLPPVSQYDAVAMPMLAMFSPNATVGAYTHIDPKINVNEMNPAAGSLAERSKKLDFSAIDRADPQELNEILWSATRPGEPYPTVVHGFKQ